MPAPAPPGAGAPVTPRRQVLPSLGQHVLRRALPVLGLAWVAGTVVSIAVAQLFAQRAFDRSLLDDAYLLATQLRVEGKHLTLNLTQRELNTVLFDQAERVYFSVRDAQGHVIAGSDALHLPNTTEGRFVFADITFQGRLLRAVTLRDDSPAPFEVTVAQTTTVRDALLRELLLYSLLPQLGVLLLLAWALGRTIRAATRPLAELERLVEDRSADDLAPVAVQADTHDVAALAEAINALLHRLQRSVQAQREFSSNVVHELRTPLAGIRALADYGLSQADPARWREQLQAVAASGARASALVDKLLALAVASEAEARLTLVPLRLDELVRDAVLRFLPRALTQGVDLGAEGVGDAVWVRGDTALIEGILNNLIGNALRHGVSPDRPTTVTVALSSAPDEIVLTVEDNGLGAPGEVQIELAARGSRGEAAQLLGQGTGLGLALVAQYARLMQARVTLGSGADGRGWVCAVHFPAAAT